MYFSEKKGPIVEMAIMDLKQNLRINSRFSNLKPDDEGNTFQRRHGGGGRMNRRNRSYRPKRSKEEFLNYMAEKHNGTFKNNDLMAFAKSIKPKSPKQKIRKREKEIICLFRFNQRSRKTV